MAAPAALAALAVTTTLLQLIKYAVYALLAVLVYVGVNPVKRWQYRHIPGSSGWPFLGDLVAISGGFMPFLETMKKRHGRIFKIWFGTKVTIVVCDQDAARKIGSRLNHQEFLPNALINEERFLVEHMMVFLKPEQWKVMRKAWEPALLQRASLEGYLPLMQDCADDLLERLAAVPQGEVVDIQHEVTKLTMDIVGSIAFGIKFHDSSSGAEEAGLGGDYLRAVAKKFMGSMDADKSSAWMAPMFIFPAASEWIRRLACRFPDSGQKLMVQGMSEMGAVAHKLIRLCGSQRQAAEAAPVGKAEAGADSKAGGPARVMPGSFVAQLEAWRNKYEGSVEISDSLLAAQVITFLLGGYETASYTLCFLLYRLSKHPEAQRKLQQELDTVLGGRKPTLDDLPKLVYLEACMKESARLHTVAYIYGRVYHGNTGGDPPTLELLGKNIPHGTGLMAMSFDTHVDPEYWVRPQEFLPERFLPEVGGSLVQPGNPLFHFGWGARKCMGYKFAEQEMVLVTASLFQRFSLTRPEGLGPLKLKQAFTLQPAEGVMVLVRPRQ